MYKSIAKVAIGLSLVFSGYTLAGETAKKTMSESTVAAPENPHVILQTSMGEMTLELYLKKAPKSVENFLAYVDKGFYDGVIFHRIIPNFMVQVGGFDQKYNKKTTMAPIVNESANGLKNLRGTLSMARTMNPNSATAQFFINLVNNQNLDGSPSNAGYAVFGKVIKGIEAIDKMAAQPQGNFSGTFVNAPNEQIIIEKAYRVKTEAKKPQIRVLH